MTLGLDVATGLVSAVLYDGLKRPMRAIHSEAIRRQEIARAFVGTAEPDIKANNRTRALDDLAKFLGHNEGLLTEHVNAFLTELRRSAVLDAILRCAMVGKSYDQVFPAFEVLYASFAPLPFKSLDIFRALCVAIQSQVEFASDDPAMLEVMRAIAHDLRQTIGELTSSLGRATQLLHPLPHAQYAELRLRVAKAIETDNREIAVETDRGPKRHPITKLVVPARLRPTDRVSPELPTARSKDPTTGLIDFRRSFYRAAILGDPGGGKSTSIQYLCYSIARQVVLSSTSDREFEPKDIRLPLKVVVRSLDRRQQANPAYSILDFLRDELRQVLDNDEALALQFLVQMLSVGNAIVLFDGLDEILDVARRRQMVVQLEQFARTYAACPVLVTSRVIGYRDAPLADDYDTFILSRFNRDEVYKFATNLITVVRGIKKKEASKLADEFAEQTENIASDLRENPLMLGLMVYLFLEQGAVPDNRPEIYKQCSQLMFVKWDKNRGIRYELPPRFQLMDVFGYTATRIFGDPDAEDGVSRDWLARQMEAFFETWYGDRPRAVEAASTLVDFITGRAWVMCDIGPDKYKFTHRTFLEYFVAKRIESESESVAALVTSLYPRIVRAEWDVVCHLALQIAADSGPKSTKALDTLLELLRDEGVGTPEELNLLYFTCRSLEYLDVPEPRLQEVVRVVLHRCLEISDGDAEAALSVIATLLVHARKKLDAVRAEIYFFTQSALKVRGKERRFGWYLLGTQEVKLRTGLRLGEHYGNAIWTFFDELRDDSEHDIRTAAMDDVEAARAWWYIYRNYDVEVYRKFGADAIFCREHQGAPEHFQMLPYIILSWAVQFQQHDHRTDSSRVRSAVETLCELGADAVRSGVSLRRPYIKANSLGPSPKDYLEFAIRRVIAEASRSRVRRSPALMRQVGLLLVSILVFVEIEDIARIGPEAVRRPKKLKRNSIINTFPQMRSAESLVSPVAGTDFEQSVRAWAEGELSFVR